MIFGKKSKNNRIYPRADFFQSSYFMVDNNANRATAECWCNNISLGGISFDSEQAGLDSAVVNILYKIGPHMRKDRLAVRFAKKFMTQWRYGGQFTDPDPQRSELIGRYVEQKQPR
jgi:hypothetical protein